MHWTNLLWLFWLSLVPVATAAIGRHPHDPITMNDYGVVQLACAAPYRWLWQSVLSGVKLNPDVNNWLRRQERKGRSSVVFFAAALPIAWVHPGWSFAIYICVAVAYVVPSRDFSEVMGTRSH